jgi:hypothetical protein
MIHCESTSVPEQTADVEGLVKCMKSLTRWLSWPIGVIFRNARVAL